MLRLLSIALLLFTITCAIHFRLNTNQITRLNIGDSLISTMGLFKATLLQNQCVLSIQTFNNNSAYTKLGNYSSPGYNGNCNYLQISQGRVATNDNFTYLSVGPSTTYNISTILTIDDIGIIRLIGTYQLPDFRNQVSFQINVTTFTTPHTYVTPASQMTVNFMQTFGPLTNQGNWVFSSVLGQLDIEQFSNPGLFISYSYSGFKLNNSLIYDFPGSAFPATIFPNITFNPRCVQPRLYLEFKPPYILVIDQFWPIASVYEQGRYKIAQVSYAKIFQPQAWQTQRRLFFRSQHSVCPPYSFKFKGTCVTLCPQPYYHELRGIFGQCVLTCEQYTPRNDTTRVCSCFTADQDPAISSEKVQTCPSNSIKYAYGCYCNQTNMYFDRTLTFSCVSTCPQKTFASSGLCMECPNLCLTCQVDRLYRSYLECMQCQPGFNIVNGQCYRICSPGLGNSLVNGNCQPCSDPNCLDCSSNVGVCKRCNLLHAVSNGACVQNCLNNTQISFFDNLNSVCLPIDSSCSSSFSSFYKTQSTLKCITCNFNTYLHVDKCVNQCPIGYSPNANNYCVCNTNGTLTVDNLCLTIAACPIRMGWDSLSSSCVSCQYGCLTCYDNGCTSCFPGYFLYVSPQGVFCRRKSPLYDCVQQYSWINGICLLKQFSNPLFRLTRCLPTILNCQACFPNSDTICASCNSNFFLVNNTCQSACPTGTIPYGIITCILPQIKNCSIPYLEIKYQSTVIDYNRIQRSDPYSFYTFNGRAESNDPVGYIPVFQQLTSRKNDGIFRDTQFFFPKWTCLKCADGMGLSPDFSQCITCTPNCLTCYMAQNDSCLTTSTVVTGCTNFIDYLTNQCIQTCSSDATVPYVSNGIAYCYPKNQAPTSSVATIDSSTYRASDGTTTVFFVLDTNVQNGNTVNLPIQSEGTAPRVANAGQRVGANVQNAQLTNGYIVLQDTNPSNQLWILNTTNNVQNVAVSSNVALSNTVYGVSNGQGHSVFMKTWLAYIGYIMGIVLICLHAVFIGNDLLYKVDNTLILAQMIYFFSFVQLLVGKLLSQFYYGWLFSMFGFFPNFFKNLIPSNYVELAAPNSYKLSTMDANIIRNAGWAISLFLVFLGGWALITFICWMLKTCCNKTDAWHPSIAVNSLIGCGQFLSFPVFYWAVANMLYIGNSQIFDPGFHRTSRSVSIFFIVLIGVYAIGRWFFNVLGGLYMFKRIIMATILAASYLDNRMLAPLVLTQAVFCLVRYLIQSPQKARQIWTIIIECLLHIAVYLLAFLSLSAGANTIIMSIIIFIAIVIVAYGLTELYLQSQNEWQIEQKEEDGTQGSIVAAERGPRKDQDNED